MDVILFKNWREYHETWFTFVLGAIGTAVFMFFRRRNRGKMMAMFNSTGNAMENMIGTAGKEAASAGKQSIRTSNAMDKQRVQDIIAKILKSKPLSMKL
ncbi:hypothetical protein P7H17_23150 [Paenibacillus larvae]|nr:hypothetical protein [Paenibacillus larvae]MDT2242424.1 hypothetical protein [Paenibacillus larvae]MDT2288365.1 hypothetical protein [Paenibacillus larvae]MDT2292193.1 hypothetical protein [Paenibacillus larvae]